MTVSTRSPLRYPGGKFRARKILGELVPSSVKHVLSPFFGGGSFELYLTGQGVKVTGFDGFPVLANFWTHLLEEPEALAAETNKLYGKVSKTVFNDLKKSLEKNDSGLKAASDFFIVNRCSFSGATLSGGYSQASADTRFTENSIKLLENFQNKFLTVEQAFFENSLKNIPNNVDLLFLDPPYKLDDSKNTLYGIGGDLHKEFNHESLHELTVNSGKDFLLTYNNTAFIKDLWKDFEIIDTAWAYGMNASKKSSEIIIKNF